MGNLCSENVCVQVKQYWEWAYSFFSRNLYNTRQDYCPNWQHVFLLTIFFLFMITDYIPFGFLKSKILCCEDGVERQDLLLSSYFDFPLAAEPYLSTECCDKTCIIKIRFPFFTFSSFGILYIDMEHTLYRCPRYISRFCFPGCILVFLVSQMLRIDSKLSQGHLSTECWNQTIY